MTERTGSKQTGAEIPKSKQIKIYVSLSALTKVIIHSGNSVTLIAHQMTSTANKYYSLQVTMNRKIIKPPVKLNFQWSQQNNK